jgi:hypothetical protein
VTQLLGGEKIEYEVHLHFDRQSLDEHLAEIA